jgi:hypothetical protein
MAEKIFDAQTNYGWGLTFNLTGKAPAISKRIFNTLADAQAYADDFNDSAVEGLLLSVVADANPKNNGAYFVETIKTSAESEPALLKKVGDVDLEELQKLIDAANETIREEFTKADEALLEVIDTNETIISKAIVDLNDRTVLNTDDIKLLDQNVKNYTINEKKVSENPVLDTDDFLIGEAYSVLDQPLDNVAPGDLLTTAISKIEVMLANTTLSLTAAINDLDARIGNETVYDAEGNVVKEATGLYKKYEELSALINK